MLSTKILVTRDMNETELKFAMYAAATANTEKYLANNEILRNYNIDWVDCNKKLIDKIILKLEKLGLDLRQYIDACNIYNDLMMFGQVHDAQAYQEIFFKKKYGFVIDITVEHLQNYVYEALRKEGK